MRTRSPSARRQTTQHATISRRIAVLTSPIGASAFDNNDRWLEITVEGVPLVPRQPISRTPYAIQTRGIFVDDAGNIGTGTPIFPLHIESDGASDGTTAIYGRATDNTLSTGATNGGRRLRPGQRYRWNQLRRVWREQ